jgi:hypothetical protein
MSGRKRGIPPRPAEIKVNNDTARLRPFPSEPQFAPDSKIWQREHPVADDSKPATPGRDKLDVAKTSYGQTLEFQ